MAEYIEREAVVKRVQEIYCVGCNSYHGVRCRACGTGDAIDIIEDFPTADVAPVVHGRWIKDNEKSALHIEAIYLCSACHNYEAWGKTEKTPYCPNCGAKMDERDEDE